MISLDKQLHQFTPEFFGAMSDFLTTAESNERDTLMLACSDHGAAPDNVSFAGPDRFFILQHIAASVPAAGASAGSDIVADIGLAFDTLNVRHAIICGHLACGVIRNFLKPNCADFGGLKSQFADTTQSAVDTAYPTAQDEDRIELMICEHTLFQLENLQSHDFVREHLEAGRLRLHAWVVNDITARIHTYDPLTSAFELV